jgi:hypothetical protein
MERQITNVLLGLAYACGALTLGLLIHTLIATIW